MTEQRDVIVIGGGPAGLSAALMLGRARRDVLVLDAGSPRNRFAPSMHGLLGNEGAAPGELLERARAEVAGYGVAVVPAAVSRVVDETDGLLVTLRDGVEHRARALVVATGMTDALPDIPGLAERWGRSVLHCPYCHGWEVRDRALGVIARSGLSLHQAQLVRQWSDRVILFSAAAEPLDEAVTRRLRARDVRVVPSPVVEVFGEGADISGVRTADGETIALDAVFTMGTAEPHDGFLAGLALDRAETPFGPFLAVDGMGRTSHPRIWAAGNVANPGATVAISIGAGSLAGAAANAALVEDDFDRAEGRATGATGSAGATGSHDTSTDAEPAAPADYWEELYGSADRRWSGRVNRVLDDVASTLPPGRALDLGCGEGGDVVWLAERGWVATGVDISATAVARAEEAARAAGVGEDRARFSVADLADFADLDGSGPFDLVTASFLHSPVDLPREEILRRAAELVAPDGHLLITSHAAPPPWAGEHEHTHAAFPSPEEEIDALDLDPREWQTILAETREREATGPDGASSTLVDGVVLLRRGR